MNRSKSAIALILGIILVCGTAAHAADEPDPLWGEQSPRDYRPLRSDYVRNWYIYSDSQTNGILNPGDDMIGSFQNWWTPMSSGTQHNYHSVMGGHDFSTAPTGDLPSAPMNHADRTGGTSYFLPVEKNTLSFYMSYSQMDNNEDGHYTSHFGGSLGEYYEEKYDGANGYAFGWVSNAHDPNEKDWIQDYGRTGMDIYVHNGATNGTVPSGLTDIHGNPFGDVYSNPHVTMSNDTDPLAADPTTGAIYPLNFNDDPLVMAYDELVNLARRTWFEDNGGSLTNAEIAAIAASMEIAEVNPYAADSPGTPGEFASIMAKYGISDRSPEWILNNLVDHAGNAYTYDDAFTDRSEYPENSSDGGVIGGLAGLDNYNSEENNWGDQQVIRIDIDPETLATIDEIVFYDFGTDAGNAAGDNGQIDPTPIVFGVDNTQTLAHGQIYFDDPISGERIWFVENRLYIAQVTPEPATITLLLGGGTLLAVRRKRRRA